MKTCKKCHKTLPETDFYGKIYTCKRCICATNTAKTKLRNQVTDLPNETWLPVKGYEDKYLVSNFGRVKSIGFKTRYGLLTESPHRQGYVRVTLSDNGSSHACLVHRLVADAFIPNSDSKQTVNHINGSKADNRVENLEWATQSENNIHALNSGFRPTTTRQRQTACLRAKLNKDAVLEIKRIASTGVRQSDIADQFGVSRACICRIVNNKSRAATLKYL